MGNAAFLFFGEVNAEEVGRVTGQALAWVAALAGAWKCFSISRRPTTNTKGALALMFVLLAVLAGNGVGILTSMIEPSPGGDVVKSLAGLLTVGLLVTALVLAILGLVECSRQPGVFKQGRAQAIWALGLVALIGALAGTALVRGPAQRSGLLPTETERAKVLTFNELNFRFHSPGHPWASVKPGALNKDSKVSLGVS